MGSERGEKVLLLGMAESHLPMQTTVNFRENPKTAPLKAWRVTKKAGRTWRERSTFEEGKALADFPLPQLTASS